MIVSWVAFLLLMAVAGGLYDAGRWQLATVAGVAAVVWLIPVFWS